MSVKAKAMQFGGSCAGCVSGNDTTVRPGVEVTVCGAEEWVCAGCAEKLALKLLKAAAEARSRTSSGQVFRHDRWVTPKTPGGAA